MKFSIWRWVRVGSCIAALGALSPVVVGSASAVGGTRKPSAPARPPAIHSVGGLGQTSSAPSQLARSPLMLVLGASFTSGVGATQPSLGWAYLLAQRLQWRVVVHGVPGAGYVAPGKSFGGPLMREVAVTDISRLNPAVVILQAGHNDIGTPQAELRERVRQVVSTVKTRAPAAKLALITVFPGRRNGAEAWSTDQAIVESAREADPQAAIFDPMAQGWRFPAVADHLHPNDAGYRWIATKVFQLLGPMGVSPYEPPAAPPRRQVGIDALRFNFRGPMALLQRAGA